jgi:hypothetical protein
LRTLIERSLDAALAQRDGCGEPADAGADDDYLERSLCGTLGHAAILD